MAKLTHELLKNIISYNSETGVFIWSVFRSRLARAGDIAGSNQNRGYIAIGIAGKDYLAHRLAWFYVYGVWPHADIDHINGNRQDNRLCNLREATRSENNQNQRKAKSNNLSGILGVSFNKKSNKFFARINVDGIVKSVGYFDSAELAGAAYLKAKSKLHKFGVINA